MNSTDPRDRFATVLIYLQDVPSGGETNFPGRYFKVTSKCSKFLLFKKIRAKNGPFLYIKA